MSDDRDPLEQRLRQALPTDVPDETRARHLAALDASLSPRAARLGWRHRLGTTLAAAAAAVTPVGVAVAAEGALPGDVLYPVKQVTEQVQALVRDEVVLEHRVEELDVLLERDEVEDDTLVTAVERGVDAALAQPDEPELQERMAGLALEAARRVRDDSRLALDRLPTRQLDRTRERPVDRISPRPSPTATRPPADDTVTPRPTASPSPSPTRSPRPTDGTTVQPSDEPSPDASPTRAPSPMPADRQSPSPEPTRTDEPSPKPSPTRDDAPQRTERHEARDAGVVFIDVYADGLRVAGVRVRDGWKHELDRSREPEGAAVRFRRHDGREVLLFARWRDGQVVVHVEERDPPTADQPAGTAASTDTTTSRTRTTEAGGDATETGITSDAR